VKNDNSGLPHDTQPVVNVLPLAFHPSSRFSRGWAVLQRHRLLLGAFVMTVAGGKTAHSGGGSGCAFFVSALALAVLATWSAVSVSDRFGPKWSATHSFDRA
jgi:hypothetical protein